MQRQEDGGFSKNLYSKSFSSTRLGKLDLQSLPLAETHNGMSKSIRDLHQVPDTYRSNSGVFCDASGFASSARKISSLDGSRWKHERNGPADGSIGSSRTSQLLASSYNGYGKLLYGDKSPSPGASRTTPVWLETGETVGNTFQLYFFLLEKFPYTLNLLFTYVCHCCGEGSAYVYRVKGGSSQSRTSPGCLFGKGRNL